MGLLEGENIQRLRAKIPYEMVANRGIGGFYQASTVECTKREARSGISGSVI